MGWSMSHRIASSGALWGRSLRHFLLSTLANAGRPMSVAELIDCVDAASATLSGRASKRISDALRWEIGRCRVRRVRRGVYEFARMPKSTRRFVERRVRDLRVLLWRHAVGEPICARRLAHWAPAARRLPIARRDWPPPPHPIDAVVRRPDAPDNRRNSPGERRSSAAHSQATLR